MIAYRPFPLFLTLALAAVGCQASPKASDPAEFRSAFTGEKRLDYSLSPIHLHIAPPTTYLHVTVRTSFRKLPQVLANQSAALWRDLREAGVQPTGPLLVVYHDPSEDPGQPCEVDIGFPVPPRTQPSGDFRVSQLGAFRCASVVYHGPMRLLPGAYNRIIPRLLAGSLVPSEITRETYLDWGGTDSTKASIVIEIGIR